MPGGAYAPRPAAPGFTPVTQVPGESQPTTWDAFSNAVLHLPILGRVLHTVGAIAEADRRLYGQMVTPVTASLLSVTPNERTYGKWNQNVGLARQVSPGQALYGLVAGAFGESAGNIGLFDPSRGANAGTPVNPQFDITSPAWRESAFSRDWAGRIASGSADAAFTWYFDPLVIGGKGVSVANRAWRLGEVSTEKGLAKAVEQITAHGAYLDPMQEGGRITARGKWLQSIVERNRSVDFAAGTAERDYAARQAALLQDPVIAHATDPVGMASLFARADTYDDAATILRAGMGDTSAVEKLRRTAYDIADEIDTMRSRIQQEVDQVHNITRYDPETGRVRLEWQQTNAQLQHDKQVYEALKKRDSWLQKALANQKSGVQGVEGQLRTFTPSQAGWVNTARAAKAEAKAKVVSGYWDTKFFQAGPNGKVVKVLNWMGSEVPHGHVDLSGAPGNTAWREVLATLQEAKSSPETINKWMERWGRATSAHERAQALEQMELDLTKQVATRHGMSVKQAEEVYKQTRGHRELARTYMREGFIKDSDGSLVTAPALSVQTGGTSVPVLDFRLLEAALIRHEGGFHANWGKGVDGLLEMAGLFNQIWKPLVLLRLGYTVRNVGESTMAAFVKTGQFVANPFEGVYNVSANTVNRMRYLAHKGSTQRYVGMLDEEIKYAESARKQMGDLIAEQETLLGGKPIHIRAADIEALSTEADQKILGVRQVKAYADLRRAADEGTITAEGATQLRALHAKAARRHLTDLRKEMGGRNVKIAYRDPDTGRLVTVNNVREVPDDIWLPVAENEWTPQRYAQAVQQFGEGAGRVPYGEPLGERAMSEVYLVKPLGNGLDVTYPVGRRVNAMATAETEPGIAPVLDYGTHGADNLAGLQQTAAWYEEHLNTLRAEKEGIADGLIKRGRNGERLSSPALLHKGGETPQTYRGITYEGAFTPEYRALLESDISMGLSNENILTTMDAGKWAWRTERARYRRANSWTTYSPTDKAYFDMLTEFATVSSRDPVATRLLAGESPEAVANWLRTSAAGQSILRHGLDLPKGFSPEEYTAWLKGRLDEYFPDEVLRGRIAQGPVSKEAVVARLGGRDDLTTIHGQELVAASQAEGLRFVNAYNHFIGKAFDYLGTIPEDVASRFPMYRAVYSQEMRAQIDLHYSELVGASQEQAALRLKDFQAIARNRAVKTVKDTMYTVDRRTRPADSLRYVMPFFQVTQNRLAFYGSQLVENPHNLARLFLGWNAIGHTTNTFGEPVITVSLPDPVAKVLHLEPDTTLQFNRQSLNLMFQGEPWWSPGWGPPVTIPTAYLVREHEPDIPGWAQPLIRNILPTGAGQSGWDQVLPTVMRRFMVAWRKDRDPQYANTYALIAAQQWFLYSQGLRDKPTQDDIKQKTSDLWTFRTLAAMVLPAQPTVVSPLQPMIDKYREYQSTYKANADAMFLQDYPEFFDYVVSLSRNPTGIQPTQQANRYAEQYSNLLGTLKNPAMISLITNTPEDSSTFDTQAYQWQKGRSIAPGSGTEFRSQVSPDEALAQRAIKRGWLEYTKSKGVIDSYLTQIGAKSINDSRAAPVRAVWNLYLDKLKRSNPDWSYEFMQQDSAYYARNAADLDRIVFDDNFAKERAPGNPWVNVARQYLNIRSSLAEMLRQRKLAGGAGAIDAIANKDIKAVWDVARKKLADSDPTWSAYASRFFANDDLVEVE